MCPSFCAFFCFPAGALVWGDNHSVSSVWTRCPGCVCVMYIVCVCACVRASARILTIL